MAAAEVGAVAKTKKRRLEKFTKRADPAKKETSRKTMMLKCGGIGNATKASQETLGHVLATQQTPHRYGNDSLSSFK